MPFQKGNKLQPKHHSKATKLKISLAHKGKKAWNKGIKTPQFAGKHSGVWTGIKASYHAIHSWMLRIYGKAIKCENPQCPKTSLHYEWALIKGKKYIRKRENFWQLCKSCHRKYDLTKREIIFMHSRKRTINGTFA